MKRFDVACMILLYILLFGTSALAECSVADLRSKTPAHVKMDISEFVGIDAPVHMGLLEDRESLAVLDARLRSFLDVPATIFSDERVCKEEKTSAQYDYQVFGQNHYFEDGAYLFKWSDGGIGYSTARGDLVRQLLNYYRGDIKPLPLGEPLNADAQRALQRALDAAGAAGIPVSRNVYTCTSLSVETLKEYAERFDSEVVEGSLKKMDAYSARVDDSYSSYAFTLPLVYEGLQLEDFFYVSRANGQHVTMATLKVIVASDGMIDLSAPFVYETTGIRQEASAVLSLQEAIDALEAKLSEVLMDKHMTVFEISFAYCVQAVSAGPEGYRLHPCWVFKVADQEALQLTGQALETYKASNTAYYVLNAIDGKWLE